MSNDKLYIKSKDITDVIENMCTLSVKTDMILPTDVIDALNNYDTNISKFALLHKGIISYFEHILTIDDLEKRMKSIADYLEGDVKIISEMIDIQFDNVGAIQRFIVTLITRCRMNLLNDFLKETTFTFDFANVILIFNHTMNMIKELHKKIVDNVPLNDVITSIKEVVTYSKQFITHYHG